MSQSIQSVGLFFSRADTVASRLIRRLTGCEWSHCGLVFSGENGSVYVEALAGRKVSSRPISDLHAWVERTPGAAATVIPLSLTTDECKQVWRMAELYIGIAGYGHFQIAWMWAFIRLGIPVPHSPKRVVCSELVARCLFPIRDVRPWGRRSFDEVAPAAVWRWVRCTGGGAVK